MKKTKNLKGFTLVELIVVMAIIGVLAAVLVPGLLGYMRDSRVSAANQNAHAVMTATSSWLAKEVSANDNAADFVSANLNITAAAVKGSAPIYFNGGSGTGATHLAAVDFRAKLSESFYGWGAAVCSAGGDSVLFGMWESNALPTAAGTGANNQWNTADQDAMDGSSTHPYIGCSPLA